MSATNAFENSVLSLLFENQAIPNVGDAAGLQPSAAAGSFYVSLHTASPGEDGAQNTTEAAYTSYARASAARGAAGWTIAAGVADNDIIISFPPATGGSESETHFGLGSALSGPGILNLYGALLSALGVGTGVTPSFAVGALDVSLE